MKLNKLIWLAVFFLLPMLGHSQTATFTMTATNTATVTPTMTATNTATVTATNTFTSTPTPATLPGNYTNQIAKNLNNVISVPLLVGPTGGTVTLKNTLGFIYKYWTILINGTGGTGAVTVTTFPIPYPGGPTSSSAILSTTGAGNTSVVGITASPIPSSGIVATVGVAAATTATIYAVGSN